MEGKFKRTILVTDIGGTNARMILKDVIYVIFFSDATSIIGRNSQNYLGVYIEARYEEQQRVSYIRRTRDRFLERCWQSRLSFSAGMCYCWSNSWRRNSCGKSTTLANDYHKPCQANCGNCDCEVYQ